MTLNNDLRAAAPRPRERIIADTLNSGDDYVHYAILEVLLDIRGELSEAREERARERQRQQFGDVQ